MTNYKLILNALERRIIKEAMADKQQVNLVFDIANKSAFDEAVPIFKSRFPSFTVEYTVEEEILSLDIRW